MHDIEPYHKWRFNYDASEDKKSPFHGKVYNEFAFTNKIYNYAIHPQWDDFGSQTLYLKLLFVDYEEGFACIELIGEWNDCIANDIMYLKREIIDHLIEHEIFRFVLFCDNVLNFHGSDDCYYEEWYDDIIEKNGWICLINVLDHVSAEMRNLRLQAFLHLGEGINNINWRKSEPKSIYRHLEGYLREELKYLSN